MTAVTEPGCSRAELSAILNRCSREVCASHYLLAEHAFESGRAYIRIITANWIYDAVEELGLDAIARIADGAFATSFGSLPRPFSPSQAGELSVEESQTLARYGHGELYCFRLGLAGRRLLLLLSAPEPGMIRSPVLGASLMACRYAVAAYMRAAGDRAEQYSLTERERECLLWVSEGKTASEIAVILGVSGNTVNSYITQVIRKFRSSNRAMAIATAIRGGII